MWVSEWERERERVRTSDTLPDIIVDVSDCIHLK